MLVGFLMLGEAAGTYRISRDRSPTRPPATAVDVAVVLVLVGAVRKSALFPFHFWLPGAMAAPTPVSAYLHAAAMVKAGVYLVALLAPAFADVARLAPGRPGRSAVRRCSSAAGGPCASTTSSCCSPTAPSASSGSSSCSLGARHPAAALAGLALLVAHALFKSALFLVVGIVDHADRHPRPPRALRRRPVRAACCAVAALVAAPRWPACRRSLGFVAKEAAVA